jgi:hypothetical protein
MDIKGLWAWASQSKLIKPHVNTLFPFNFLKCVLFVIGFNSQSIHIFNNNSLVQLKYYICDTYLHFN